MHIAVCGKSLMGSALVDVQPMVRFLVYANESDVVGLVAPAGTFANIAKKAEHPGRPAA